LHILATARQAFDAYILTAGFEYILNSDHINVDANSNLTSFIGAGTHTAKHESQLSAAEVIFAK
jgi:hypothetical protein